MATSGSWNFSINRNELITASLRVARIIGRDETPDASHISNGAEALNMLVKQYQGPIDGAFGRKAWTRQRITLFLAKGQQRYTIGNASTDARATTQYGRTTVSSAYASGTSLSVAALTDTTTYPGTTVTMTAADIIGVVLDDGTISWTTISAAASSPITLGGALASAAAVGNYVYWFTSRAQRPILVETAVLRNKDYSDSPLGVYTEVEDYEKNSSKTSDGDPMSLLVEYGRINTAITCDVQPNDVTKVINLAVLYPNEDYDASTDDIAFPQEAYRALKFMLALDLFPEYRDGDPPLSLEKRASEAKAYFDRLNPETTTLCFEPGRD